MTTKKQTNKNSNFNFEDASDFDFEATEETTLDLMIVPKPLDKEANVLVSQLYDAFIELGLYVVPRRWEWIAPIHLVKRSRVLLVAGYDKALQEMVFIMNGSTHDLDTITLNADYIANCLQHHITIENGRIRVSNRLFYGQHYLIK